MVKKRDKSNKKAGKKSSELSAVPTFQIDLDIDEKSSSAKGKNATADDGMSLVSSASKRTKKKKIEESLKTVDSTFEDGTSVRTENTKKKKAKKKESKPLSGSTKGDESNKSSGDAAASVQTEKSTKKKKAKKKEQESMVVVVDGSLHLNDAGDEEASVGSKSKRSKRTKPRKKSKKSGNNDNNNSSVSTMKSARSRSKKSKRVLFLKQKKSKTHCCFQQQRVSDSTKLFV